MLMIAFSFKQTSAMMLDNTLNQSVEFLSDGIYYYQFDGPMSNFKYFFAVIFNKNINLCINVYMKILKNLKL